MGWGIELNWVRECPFGFKSTENKCYKIYPKSSSWQKTTHTHEVLLMPIMPTTLVPEQCFDDNNRFISLWIAVCNTAFTKAHRKEFEGRHWRVHRYDRIQTDLDNVPEREAIHLQLVQRLGMWVTLICTLSICLCDVKIMIWNRKRRKNYETQSGGNKCPFRAYSTQCLTRLNVRSLPRVPTFTQFLFLELSISPASFHPFNTFHRFKHVF